MTAVTAGLVTTVVAGALGVGVMQGAALAGSECREQSLRRCRRRRCGYEGR